LSEEEGFKGVEERGADTWGGRVVEDVFPEAEVAEEVV
jgi:hypothetical protein